MPGIDILLGFDVIAGRQSDHCGYRMLEDPTYSEIVRWGDEGDSFVVLEVMKIMTMLLSTREELQTDFGVSMNRL